MQSSDQMDADGRDGVLDTGIYSPGMAGALAGVSGKSVGQWARYGLIRPSVFKGRPSNLYSYFDVAEAIVVRWMLSHKSITHSRSPYSMAARRIAAAWR